MLQCKKKLGLPDEAVQDLKDLAEATGAGDEAVDDAPSAPCPAVEALDGGGKAG